MQTQPIPNRSAGRPYNSKYHGPDLKLVLDEMTEILSKDFSDVLDISEARIRSRKKQIYCYVAKMITNATLNAIGSFINHKHDVVKYNINKIEDLIDGKDFELSILWLEYTTKSAIWKQYGGKI